MTILCCVSGQKDFEMLFREALLEQCAITDKVETELTDEGSEGKCQDDDAPRNHIQCLRD